MIDLAALREANERNAAEYPGGSSWVVIQLLDQIDQLHAPQRRADRMASTATMKAYEVRVPFEGERLGASELKAITKTHGYSY